MPGDRLSLAVLVRREVELVGVLDQRFELLDLFASILGVDVDRLETLVDIDAEPSPRLVFVSGGHLRCGPGEIADVAHRGLDDHVRPEKPFDLLGFCGRFDDHECFWHGRQATAPVEILSSRGSSPGCGKGDSFHSASRARWWIAGEGHEVRRS